MAIHFTNSTGNNLKTTKSLKPLWLTRTNYRVFVRIQRVVKGLIGWSLFQTSATKSIGKTLTEMQFASTSHGCKDKQPNVIIWLSTRNNGLVSTCFRSRSRLRSKSSWRESWNLEYIMKMNKKMDTPGE